MGRHSKRLVIAVTKGYNEVTKDNVICIEESIGLTVSFLFVKDDEDQVN